MKNIFKVFFLIFSLELFANQLNGVYVELGVGLGLEDTIDTTKGFEYVYERDYSTGILLGYQYANYKFELEQSYKKDSLYSHSGAISKGNLTQESKMLNIYISGSKNRILTSLGLGFGISSIELEDEYTTTIEDDNIFTSQAIFGVGYMFRDDFILTPKYTLKYMIESDNFKAKLDNIFTLNLRYIF